ncbi:cytochrome b/b6 domain-containing protein [Tabrizicola sp. J26]|uniref:cytochrome b n=1 Tax=Alitabrizicola rongguiensis TaxID=2909234 RepID=UPI001F462BC2|nr:cytochrome b/b6 domain-containing protein [Tabrizicola rongguiensis]MCF1709220.1 cytochrome b/b6 domain-containing protein [Tabrizicola rongguiensis]
MPTPKGYSRTQISLHWIVAILLVPQLFLEDGIKGAWRAVERGEPSQTGTLAWLHIGLGIVILLLVLWRLGLRFTRGAPEALGAGLQQKAAGLVHWLLYALLIVTPMTGLAAWFGGIASAAEVHEAMKPAILILAVLHIAAALWHQFGLKDNLLNRMRQPEA